ncbi:MAG: hypothetical protein OHK0052_24360 [Anaerolineales bacterium]
MKRITKLLILLVIALMAVSPAFAFTGIKVRFKDAYNAPMPGLTGTVYVMNNTNGEIFSCPFTSDAGGYVQFLDTDISTGGGCTVVVDDGDNALDIATGDSIEYYFTFDPLTQGTPPDVSLTYTENALPILKTFPDQNLLVGPNAVTLNDFAAQSSSPALLVLAGVALLALASGALVIARKRLA